MNLQNQLTKLSLNYKLKPISLIVFSLFAQQAFAQNELVQDNVSLALSKQLADSSVIESKPSVQNNNKKLVKIVVADASTAVKSKSNNQYKTNTTADTALDVYDVLLGDDPSTTTNNIPSNADRYGASKELLKTAAVTNAQAQGTGKTNSQGKPISNVPVDINLKAVNVRAKRFHEIGPLPGLGLTKEEIPGNVQSISAKQIKDSHALSIADLMNSQLQSVNVNDYQGNPFQMDVQYRGFTASPQVGTPQGLSVFLDGIRVNEPFGDVVNWDMIPMNALSGLDVFPGSNPIFGLGTLGGALSMKTKDGFNNEGVDAEVLTGSFGRKQLQLSGGVNNGSFALFGAGNFFLEDGWRDNSPSKVNQMFGKASYRGDKLDLNLSSLIVTNDLVGNGLLPSQMYEQNRSSVYSSPDTTKNKLFQFQLSGAFQASDTFSITGQVYRRDSRRKSLGADVYTQHGEDLYRRKLNPGEEYTCLFNSTNKYKIPDYYVVDIDPNDQFGGAFATDLATNGTPNFALLAPNAFNQDLPTDFAAYLTETFNLWKNPTQALLYIPQGNQALVLQEGAVTPYSNGESSYRNDSFIALNYQKTPQNVIDFAVFAAGLGGNYYYSPDGMKHVLLVASPQNGDNCAATQALDGKSGNPLSETNPLTTLGPRFVDGINDGTSGVAGDPATGTATPTAVLTNNKIDQIVNGASVQFNWNLEHHKLMVGASIDAANATYSSGQRLGLLDANRNAYLAPDQIREQYAAASIEVHNNDFSGTTTTKSIYASETWTPVDNWHFSAAARYNDTHGQNEIASRAFGNVVLDISQFTASPDSQNVCINGVCPTTGVKIPDLTKLLNKPEKEKFSYYSLNPSLGATWQAKENLNLYANWAQGTRTPSVIELGCALDRSPTGVFYGDGQGGLFEVPKGILENRECSLPSTLSGDPYLPQIKATTYDIGMRGQIGQSMEWNLGAYQTNIKDDIYFVAVNGGGGFFDSIGKTRRRGIEAGLSGNLGAAKFKLNYALTDATFQDSFFMASTDNSSSVLIPQISTGVIEVNPGNRMPGVPLHNLNASVSYEVTPKWQVGLSAVLHSNSYVRGNENNKHKVGVTQTIDLLDSTGGVVTVTRQPTSNPGTVPGYATFNFNTRYKFSQEWALGLQINNIFDREYFSAGRLGRNAFSPSINGAIGVSGYNHNSGDWLSTNFIAPGAPRAAWISLTYEFSPDKK